MTDLTRAERRAHAEAALALVGLADRMEQLPRQLSGGQEQGVAIARALVTDPALLLANEPTGDLGAKSAHEVLTIMSRLKRDYGKTVIMVTHDPKAAAVASVVRHLDEGLLLPRWGITLRIAGSSSPPSRRNSPSSVVRSRINPSQCGVCSAIVASARNRLASVQSAIPPCIPRTSA